MNKGFTISLFVLLSILAISSFLVTVYGSSEESNCTIKLSTSGEGSIVEKVNGYLDLINGTTMPSGQVLTFTATPWYPDNSFDHFHVSMGNVTYDDISNPLTLTLNSDLRVTAYFVSDSVTPSSSINSGFDWSFISIVLLSCAVLLLSAALLYKRTKKV